MDPATTSQTPSKRPHRSISHAQKRRLCEISLENPQANHGSIAEVFKSETGRRIERSTVTRVLQKRQFWLMAGTKDKDRKRLTSPRFPTIEEALYEFIRHKSKVVALRDRLSDKDLMKHSKDIAEAMCKDSGSTDKNSTNYSVHLNSFRGSLSWVTAFRKRHHLMPKERPSRRERTYPMRPFVSSQNPSEIFDIWQTNLSHPDTLKLLSNWTRLDDFYFLDALCLAVNARPESAEPEPPHSRNQQEVEAQLDNDLGIDRHLDLHLAVTTGVPLNFQLPSIASTLEDLHSHQHNSNNNANSEVVQSQDDFPDPFGSAAAAAHEQQHQQNNNTSATTTTFKHRVSEKSVVQLLLCANGSGSDRRAPWIVGREPIQSSGGRDGKPWSDIDVRYFHNKQGWITSRLLRKWVEEFDRSVDRSVVLITSLFNKCDLEQLDLKNVTLIPIPRDEIYLEKKQAMSQWECNSLCPMHQGVEQVFRAKFRILCTKRALSYLEEERQILDPSMKTAANLIREAWDKVSAQVLRRSWRNLRYLPSALRHPSRQRGNSRPAWNHTCQELKDVISRYKEKIACSHVSDQMKISASDVVHASSHPDDFLFLPVEQSIFHPGGDARKFARCVVSGEEITDTGNDDEVVIPTPSRGVCRVESHGDALEVVNKLAEFVQRDGSMNNQSLYLIGSLQIHMKRLYEEKKNEEAERVWNEANSTGR